jgi:hypothetical protein
MLLACLLLLSGLAQAEDDPNAPVNEKTRPRVVKYLNQGADFIIKGRRKDAYKEMHDDCGGPYRIDAEGPREEGGLVVKAAPGVTSFGNWEYWYIQYSCVTK